MSTWKPGTPLRRTIGCEQYARILCTVVGGTLVELLGPSHTGQMVIPCDKPTHSYTGEWEIVATLPAECLAVEKRVLKMRKDMARDNARARRDGSP